MHVCMLLRQGLYLQPVGVNYAVQAVMTIGAKLLGSEESCQQGTTPNYMSHATSLYNNKHNGSEEEMTQAKVQPPVL